MQHPLLSQGLLSGVHQLLTRLLEIGVMLVLAGYSDALRGVVTTMQMGSSREPGYYKVYPVDLWLPSDDSSCTYRYMMKRLCIITVKPIGFKVLPLAPNTPRSNERCSVSKPIFIP